MWSHPKSSATSVAKRIRFIVATRFTGGTISPGGACFVEDVWSLASATMGATGATRTLGACRGGIFYILWHQTTLLSTRIFTIFEKISTIELSYLKSCETYSVITNYKSRNIKIYS